MRLAAGVPLFALSIAVALLLAMTVTGSGSLQLYGIELDRLALVLLGMWLLLTGAGFAVLSPRERSYDRMRRSMSRQMRRCRSRLATISP